MRPSCAWAGGLRACLCMCVVSCIITTVLLVVLYYDNHKLI